MTGGGGGGGDGRDVATPVDRILAAATASQRQLHAEIADLRTEIVARSMELLTMRTRRGKTADRAASGREAAAAEQARAGVLVANARKERAAAEATLAEQVEESEARLASLQPELDAARRAARAHGGTAGKALLKALVEAHAALRSASGAGVVQWRRARRSTWSARRPPPLPPRLAVTCRGRDGERWRRRRRRAEGGGSGTDGGDGGGQEEDEMVGGTDVESVGGDDDDGDDEAPGISAAEIEEAASAGASGSRAAAGQAWRQAAAQRARPAGSGGGSGRFALLQRKVQSGALTPPSPSSTARLTPADAAAKKRERLAVLEKQMREELGRRRGQLRAEEAARAGVEARLAK